MRALAPEMTWRDRRLAVRRGVPLIDLRSPSEHAKGAIPGACNIPLFDDRERALVGTTYKQEGSKAAVALGLELFAAKAGVVLAEIDRKLEALGANPPEILVHCWRGGMRSGSVALWLRSMGYTCQVLPGGYKAYRQEVLGAIEALASHDLLVLDGRTGAGKTALLRTLGPDFPLIDFEGIARHRGSAFGDFSQAEPVPTQQNFENQLADRYWDVAHHPRLVVEIENFIGPIILSDSLRKKVFSAPMVLVEREFDDRIERLAAEYAAAWNDKDDALFVERMALLNKHLSKEQQAKIKAAVETRDFPAAIRLFLELRYDKVYDKGIAKRQRNVIARFNLTHEEDAALAFLRKQIRGARRP